MPGKVKGNLGYVLGHQGDHNILPLIENAVEARTELSQNLSGNRCECLLPVGRHLTAEATAPECTACAEASYSAACNLQPPAACSPITAGSTPLSCKLD